VAKLLILDDEQDTLAWMSAALEARGHVVRCCLSGRTALEVLEHWCPDLIITDILMPEMEGLTFARVAQQCRGVPVMFVSIATKQAEAILCGAVGYVQKPATAAEVRAAVERVLGRGAERNTILIVDDDAEIRHFHRLFLEPRFIVIEAENGLVALDLLRGRGVDLAIVDVHMPVMNGVELIRAIRADPALQRLPIIVQTSDKAALDIPVWRDLHVAHVVSKQDFLEWLSERIEAHMEGLNH